MDQPNQNQLSPQKPPALKANEVLGASGKIYRESMKFNEWTRLILDKKNTDTFGNFTQAALLVYALDESDPKQYSTANAIGSQNYRKLKDIASLTLQKKGLTFGSLMDILMARAATSQSSTWWEITMEMMGYRDRRPAANINQYNQINNFIPLNDEQLGQQFQDAALADLGETELTQILIAGDVSAGDKQEPASQLYPEELRDDNPPEQNM